MVRARGFGGKISHTRKRRTHFRYAGRRVELWASLVIGICDAAHGNDGAQRAQWHYEVTYVRQSARDAG
jgi:hypothetical protein